MFYKTTAAFLIFKNIGFAFQKDNFCNAITMLLSIKNDEMAL